MGYSSRCSFQACFISCINIAGQWCFYLEKGMVLGSGNWVALYLY
jgi:hypothetical protein